MTPNALFNRDLAEKYLVDQNDRVLRTAMDMITVIIIQKWKDPSGYRLQSDFDLRFLSEVLSEFFSDHDVIKKVLSGERPGAWDDEI
jgi:hypothetical protein